MILITHILIALSSVAYSAHLFLAPSDERFRNSHILVGLTIASGTLLVVATGAHILRACVLGLAFVAASYVAIALAKKKLARERSRI